MSRDLLIQVWNCIQIMMVNLSIILLSWAVIIFIVNTLDLDLIDLGLLLITLPIHFSSSHEVNFRLSSSDISQSKSVENTFRGTSKYSLFLCIIYRALIKLFHSLGCWPASLPSLAAHSTTCRMVTLTMATCRCLSLTLCHFMTAWSTPATYYVVFAPLLRMAIRLTFITHHWFALETVHFSALPFPAIYMLCGIVHLQNTA